MVPYNSTIVPTISKASQNLRGVLLQAGVSKDISDEVADKTKRRLARHEFKECVICYSTNDVYGIVRFKSPEA